MIVTSGKGEKLCVHMPVSYPVNKVENYEDGG
jgi:hypothetical protein